MKTAGPMGGEIELDLYILKEINIFICRMPLPDYGHHNAEKKTHQDMVTIVSIESKK